MAVYDLYFVFLFLPIVLFSYYMVTDGLIRRWLLILASLFFYAWGEPTFVLIIHCAGTGDPDAYLFFCDNCLNRLHDAV